MKNFLLIVFTMVLLVCTGCSGTKNYQIFPDWDSSKDGGIERREFVDAYVVMDYFDKWSNGKSSIDHRQLFETVFGSMDCDKDNKLSLVEFNSQIELFYFGLFSESFLKWDDDANASISKLEFDKHVPSTNLAAIWDTSDDRQITEREMAGGMFYICDTNSNGKIDQIELEKWKRNR